jgi:hypothetical protein
MEEYKLQFDRGLRPKNNPEYKNLDAKISWMKRKNNRQWNSTPPEIRKEMAKDLNALRTAKLKTQRQLPQDRSYKRLQYIRYADDFIIGIIGSQSDAAKIKEDIRLFLAEKLKLTLSEEKTKITHTSKCARFLSYDIMVSRSQAIAKDKNGVRRRAYYRMVKLYVPHEKWAQKLKELGAIKVSKDKAGNERYKATHRSAFINREDIEILNAYNSEVRGLYNYYCIANNAHVIGKFGGLMYHSMCRTFAGKYNTKVKAIKSKYAVNGEFTVAYPTKSGLNQKVFYNQGYGRKDKVTFADLNVLPAYRKYNKPNSMAARLRTECCELCGATGEAIVVHQVKRLKDLTGHSEWETKMREMRRKTLIVCEACHEQIHKSLSVKVDKRRAGCIERCPSGSGGSTH